jgi:hypothetical protein
MPETRKVFPAAAFILALLLSAVTGTMLVKLGVANPVYEERWEDLPIISIHSPVNETHVNSVLLNFTIAKPESWLSTPVSFEYEAGSGLAQQLLSVSYYVDGKSYGSVVSNNNLSSSFNYCVYLMNLTEGEHILMVRANATGVVRDWTSDKVYNVPINSSSTVHFTLDTALPSFSVLSFGIAAMTATLVGIGLLAYFRKHSH